MTVEKEFEKKNGHFSYDGCKCIAEIADEGFLYFLLMVFRVEYDQ